MVDIRLSILDNTYHLTTDERQFILCRVVPSKAKNAIDGYVETDTKYFRSMDSVKSYLDRVTPIQTSKVLSSIVEVEAVQGIARESVEALCVEESK